MINRCLFVVFTLLVLASDAQQDRTDEKGLLKVFEKHKHNVKEKNITNVIANNEVYNYTIKAGVTCDDARIKCALRQGCGTALQTYMLDCSDIMKGRTDHCDEFCKASLIALTSTEEGESLINCLCKDDFCMQSKERLEVCRREVISANAQNAIVSCSVAHLICSADTSCSTALYYYDKLCRRMFSGRSCSLHCNNSISILGRQKKAEKLSNCICDGTESFACARIKKNMATLCFHHIDNENIQKKEESNEINTEQTNLINGSNSIISSSAHFFNFGIVCVSIFLKENALYLLHGNLNTKKILFLFGLTLSVVVRWDL